MSPVGRRGRMLATSDESHLRNLSPSTTLRAFTQRPMPYDTTRDEYKVFACIDALTPAERDLGVRVAKAAQRLKNWCNEIEQWGWSGSFEPPTEEYRETRRRSLQMRIQEHVKEPHLVDQLPPLEYWGSLLSIEVQAHEARLDEISEELITLDVEELKGHVLDLHPRSRSRPPSAGYDATRSPYKPLDDFDFLITQTLLSALPHHLQLKDRLNTWTARVTVLREAPRYLHHLKTAQNAMRLGWEALCPPKDLSDDAFGAWKNTVDAISTVMGEKVIDLGRRLDRMLDTLETRDDCLPDDWIDVFESVEADFGRWAQESRRKIIEFDVRRQAGPVRAVGTESDSDSLLLDGTVSTAFRNETAPPGSLEEESFLEEGDTVIHNDIDQDAFDSPEEGSGVMESTNFSDPNIVVTHGAQTPVASERPHTPLSRRGSVESLISDISFSSSPPGTVDQSPSVRNATNRATKTPLPALNAAMTKRRKNAREMSTDNMPPWPPTQFSHKSPASADDLERKISDILTTIPAHIRLTSSTGADARDPKASRGVGHKGSKGYLRAARSFSGMKSPELTLSPVRPDLDSANQLSGRRSVASLRGDNDIRMYHLTQPGKEHPVKLFIRRVGENGERVMVRVGGGWADLGEYLRQYAEHHGRRTASNGQFEILGLEVKSTDPTASRPESAMSRRDRRVSGGTQIVSPTTTPIRPRTAIGFAQDEARPQLPLLSPTPTISNDHSTPSTESSHRSWRGDEVGLAGPNTKKMDLSNEKLEWIEGMMKQARSVSGNLIQTAPQAQNDRAESRSESRTSVRKHSQQQQQQQQQQHEFGDLGKVGGTKRLFLRNGVLSEH